MAMTAQSESMQQAVTFVQQMNMSPRDRALAEAYLRDTYEKRSAYAEGEARGEAKGRAEGLLSVVLNMLKKKFSFDQIADATGFTVSEVERMAAEHSLA